MSRIMNKPVLLSVLLPMAAGISGCVSFAAKPPPSLLTLTSAASLPAGQTQNSANSPTILILVPAVSQALATTRVPVQTSGTSIAYVSNAVWVEQPARLFARLLSDTVAANTGRVVVSAAQSFADPGARLSGELRAFGVDSATGDAVVTFDASLTRGSGNAIEKRRFEARAPLSAIDATNAGIGLNQAANQVATQVAEWVGR